MIVSILKLTIVDGKAAQGLAAIGQALAQTRAAPGCHGVEVIQDLDDPHQITIIEKWASLADDIAYREEAAQRAATSPLKGLIAGPRALSRGEQRDEI